MIAAEQYACRLVVPQSQQHAPMRWGSHKDHARKALVKLCGPHLPTTLRQLDRAVVKAHAEYQKSRGLGTRTEHAAREDDVPTEVTVADHLGVARAEEEVDKHEGEAETEPVDLPTSKLPKGVGVLRR